MSGFGSGSFGSGPFGQSDWGRAVSWGIAPSIDRDADTNQYLENFLLASGRSFNLLRDLAARLDELRDPLQVRTRHNDGVEVTATAYAVTLAEDSENGEPYITFTISALTAPLLETVAPGWIIESDDRNYTVRALHKVDLQISVWGDDLPSDSTFTIRPPSIIEYLGHDFGLEIDGHEPEGFQRNLVSEAVQWYGMKGTSDGIRLRAQLAGFTAEVIPLYEVDASWAETLPPGDIYEIPTGGGVFYTGYAPRFASLDDVAADYVPLDYHCDLEAEITWPVVVTAVAGDSSAWEMTTASDLAMISTPGHWILTDSNDQVFYVEASEAGLVTVAGEIEPVNGTYTLSYDCQEAIDCNWCRSYKIALEMTISDPEIASNPLALDGAFERLIEKVNAILPAHVEAVQFTLVTSDEISVYVEASGNSGYYDIDRFDDVAADAHPTDDGTFIPS